MATYARRVCTISSPSAISWQDSGPGSFSVAQIDSTSCTLTFPPGFFVGATTEIVVIAKCDLNNIPSFSVVREILVNNVESTGCLLYCKGRDGAGIVWQKTTVEVVGQLNEALYGQYAVGP